LSDTFFAWIFRICSRPFTSGQPTVTCRSNRPGRGHDDDARADCEAVHFDQQLIERLLALLMAERVAAAAPAHGVELVDEDDAGRMAPGVLEQFAHARGADPGVHLDEIRAACEEERHARLAGNRLRQQRLARAGRSDEQHALRDTSADGGEARRLAQKIDELLHFLFRFVHARDVGEGHRGRFLARLARLALEGGDAAAGHAEEREAEQAEERRSNHERAVAERRLLGRGLDVNPHAPFRQVRHEGRVRRHVVRRGHRAKGPPISALVVQRVACDDDFRHHAAVEIAQQVRKRHLRHGQGSTVMEQEGAGHRRQQKNRGGDPHRATGPLASKHGTLRFVQRDSRRADSGASAPRVLDSFVSRNFRGGAETSSNPNIRIGCSGGPI
jgi:hypothetical protein